MKKKKSNILIIHTFPRKVLNLSKKLLPGIRDINREKNQKRNNLEEVFGKEVDLHNFFHSGEVDSENNLISLKKGKVDILVGYWFQKKL